tara:strand:+ start:647 stop:1609 length:963 start_codon:yes stop_codon:yes gene_type:complete
MAKELYLYGGVHEYSVEDLLEKIEANMDEEIVLRLNTPGGNVLAGWGLIAKMREHGNVTIKVDGSAMSMGAVMLPFAKKVEALDVSRILIHRADMYVSSPEDQAFLDGINKDLRAKLTSKIDEAKLKEITGFSISDIFNPKQRLDVILDAKQAKKIGLVDKVNKLSPEEAKAMTEKLYNVAASAAPVDQEVKPNVKLKPLNMDIDKLKADHPLVFAAVFALGVTKGADDHKELCAAWNQFSDVDAEAVKAGIESGVAPKMSEVITLMKKGGASAEVAAIEVESTGIVEAGVAAEVVADGKEENKELIALEAAMNAESENK